MKPKYTTEAIKIELGALVGEGTEGVPYDTKMLVNFIQSQQAALLDEIEKRVVGDDELGMWRGEERMTVKAEARNNLRRGQRETLETIKGELK